MKTIYQLKRQRAALACTVSIMQIDGKISKEEANRRHNLIWRAYANCLEGKRIY